MKNKNLMAVLAATTITTSAFAGISITGDYEGIISDGNPGAATYAQDLDLTLVGQSGGSTITVMMEDLTGGSTVKSNQVFIETSLEGINFKGGNYKGQNGAGLMQKKSAVTNQMEVGFDVAGTGLTLGQASGDGNATVDTSVSLAGVSVKAQNITNDERYITVTTDVAGMNVVVETQDTTTGTNTAGSISTNIAGFTLTGVMIDVEDAVGVTQDDGILGDVSDATNGKTVKGVVASTDTNLGTVTGKYITKNELDTYLGQLDRGVWSFKYSKTENVDGVASAEINVSF